MINTCNVNPPFRFELIIMFSSCIMLIRATNPS
nr:MAG TPA: hypothetical protein [Caudoviricetes sp.]